MTSRLGPVMKIMSRSGSLARLIVAQLQCPSSRALGKYSGMGLRPAFIANKDIRACLMTSERLAHWIGTKCCASG